MPSSASAHADLSSTVKVALVARIQALEGENYTLRRKLAQAGKAVFCIEQIAENDSLVSLYTGFPSYEVLLAFFEFLGPAAHNLHYHGSKSKVKRRRATKLTPLNQFFMTLVKLRLDLNILDIAYRFGVFSNTVSRYFVTWICFLYHQLTELDWYPTTEQVKGTMPSVFHSKYPPLQLQSLM